MSLRGLWEGAVPPMRSSHSARSLLKSDLHKYDIIINTLPSTQTHMMWSCFFALSLLGSRGACRVRGRRRNGMLLFERKIDWGVKSLRGRKLSTTARGHEGRLRCPRANASLTQEKLQERHMVLEEELRCNSATQNSLCDPNAIALSHLK